MIINFIETNGRTCAGMAISENDLLDYVQYGEGNCNITLCTDNETVTFMKRDNVWFVLVGRESFSYTSTELRKLLQFEFGLNSSRITRVDCVAIDRYLAYT